jgi:DNA-binding NarL/FixJ family response regulator
MEALRLVHQLEPDVLVVDQDMDDVRGVEVAAHLGFAGMNIRVVLYTIRDEPRNDELAGGSDPTHLVLDEESVVALVAAIRRPPMERLAARAN